MPNGRKPHSQRSGLSNDRQGTARSEAQGLLAWLDIILHLAMCRAVRNLSLTREQFKKMQTWDLAANDKSTAGQLDNIESDAGT